MTTKGDNLVESDDNFCSLYDQLCKKKRETFTFLAYKDIIYLFIFVFSNLIMSEIATSTL